MRPFHTPFLLTLASVCLIFFIASGAQASEQETVKFERLGLPVKGPEIKYIDEYLEERTLETKDHPLTLLHFWATWCVPCVDELPQIDDAQKIFGKKLQVAAIAMDGKNVIKVQRFLTHNRIKNIRVMLDPNNKAPTVAGLKGLPGTLFLDAKGRIIARADGPLDWQHEDVVSFISARLK